MAETSPERIALTQRFEDQVTEHLNKLGTAAPFGPILDEEKLHIVGVERIGWLTYSPPDSLLPSGNKLIAVTEAAFTGLRGEIVPCTGVALLGANETTQQLETVRAYWWHNTAPDDAWLTLLDPRDTSEYIHSFTPACGECTPANLEELGHLKAQVLANKECKSVFTDFFKTETIVIEDHGTGQGGDFYHQTHKPTKRPKKQSPSTYAQAIQSLFTGRL